MPCQVGIGDLSYAAGPSAEAESTVATRATESNELAELLLLCGQLSHEAFAEFYDRTCARVFGRVLRIVRDHGYAEEITQETYLHVWRAAAGFDPGRGTALTWLMTLAHRRAVDRVRCERARTQRDFTYGVKALGPEFDEVTAEVEQRLEQQAVRTSWAVLTEIQQEAIGLAYYHGQSYSEVARHLGVGLPAVKSRIRDGLLRLKTNLQ